jgi:hypothetical protein
VRERKDHGYGAIGFGLSGNCCFRRLERRRCDRTAFNLVAPWTASDPRRFGQLLRRSATLRRPNPSFIGERRKLNGDGLAAHGRVDQLSRDGTRHMVDVMTCESMDNDTDPSRAPEPNDGRSSFRHRAWSLFYALIVVTATVGWLCFLGSLVWKVVAQIFD